MLPPSAILGAGRGGGIASWSCPTSSCFIARCGGGCKAGTPSNEYYHGQALLFHPACHCWAGTGICGDHMIQGGCAYLCLCAFSSRYPGSRDLPPEAGRSPHALSSFKLSSVARLTSFRAKPDFAKW